MAPGHYGNSNGVGSSPMASRGGKKGRMKPAKGASAGSGRNKPGGGMIKDPHKLKGGAANSSA